MSQNEVIIQPWPHTEPPTEAACQHLMTEEGLHPYRWSNRAGDVYSAHTHSYHKVIYVVRGSITFGLPTEGRKVQLGVGDRLDLPAGVRHDAVVGPEGVACLEGHRR